MPILKKKIRLLPIEDFEPEHRVPLKVEDFCSQRQLKPNTPYLNTKDSPKPFEVQPTKHRRCKLEYKSYDESRSTSSATTSTAMKGTKIVRNYAKALCSFAYSNMALGYLQEIIGRDYNGCIEIEEFRKYIKEKKGKTASICSLRGLLMENMYDPEKEKAYKKIFTEISVIFIKFFAVNWIFSGKVKYRLEHLKYRHKMLRRIRNPEFFTYLKS